MEIKERPQLDVTEFVGKAGVIVKSTIEAGQFGLFLKLETGTIATLPNNEALTATKILGFALDKQTGQYYIAQDSPMHKFLQAKQIGFNRIPDQIAVGMELDAFHGTKIVCQKNVKGYLEIS